MDDTYMSKWKNGEKGGRGSSTFARKTLCQYLQYLFDQSESLADFNNRESIDRIEGTGEQGESHEQQ